MESRHHGAGAVELAVQVPPLPIAVLRRRRLEGPSGGLAVLELQGRRGGRDIRPIVFPAFGLAAPAGLVAGLLGPLLGDDRPAELLLRLDIGDEQRSRQVVRPLPLPEDRREGDEAGHDQPGERPGRDRIPSAPTQQPAEEPHRPRRIGL